MDTRGAMFGWSYGVELGNQRLPAGPFLQLLIIIITTGSLRQGSNSEVDETESRRRKQACSKTAPLCQNYYACLGQILLIQGCRKLSTYSLHLTFQSASTVFFSNIYTLRQFSERSTPTQVPSLPYRYAPKSSQQPSKDDQR